MENLDEALRHLKIHKRMCLGGGVKGGILLEHIMTLKHGIELLKQDSFPIHPTRDFKSFFAYMMHKLYSLTYLEKDESLFMKLDNAYTDLREKMKKLVMKPGTNEFPEGYPRRVKFESLTCSFLSEKIKKLLTSDCKANQISPIMNELEDIKKLLYLLEPLFQYAQNANSPMTKNDEVDRIFTTVTSVLDRATCFIYLSFVGKMDDEMVLFLKNSLFDLIIEEAQVMKMYLILDIEGSRNLEPHIYMSMRLLEWNKKCYWGTKMGAALEDHFMSIKHGLTFLVKILEFSTDMDLKLRIQHLLAIMKQKLYSLPHNQEDANLMVNLEHAYGELREEMQNVVIKLGTNEYYPYNFRGVNEFLLEKITILVTSNYKADLVSPLKKELQDLQKMLTLLQPLGPCIEHIEDRNYSEHWKGPDGINILTTLLTFHRKTTFLIYLSFVGKMDMEMVLSLKSNISKIKETNVEEMYNMILNEDMRYVLSGRYIEDELYVLENLIFLLKKNIYSNHACSKLYEVLNDIHSFLLGLSPNVLLRKHHLLETSFQAILSHSIPIFCSCYLEHTEVHNSAELICVVDLIKYIKTEAHEIKLYYFPRVDDLGFLEFFSEYLEDLKKSQEISLKEEIDALHFEVHSLLSLSKVSNLEEISETLWADIVNMAYQAEHIIDLIIVNRSRDLGLIPSLSKIIEQLKNIRAYVHCLYAERLASEDVAVMSEPQVLGTATQVSDNDAMVGFQEEAKIITDYLLMGEKKLDVISIVGMAGVGKTTLALSIYNTSSKADVFDILAWCTVSQNYQNRDLVLSILDQINTSDKSHRSILKNQDLADHLCRCLKKRRYLIVLDDIWDTSLWSYLKLYLPDYKEGSRIIITTRNKDVADQIGSKVNELHELSEEKSWELFEKKMLGKERLYDDLLKISRGIVEHCKGLPLSIVIIAGILSGMERTEKRWNQIAENVSSLVLKDPQGNCKAILELSYNHLPNHLRSCFLYLGLFPEDQEISVIHLIDLWISEGFVRERQSDNTEEVAKRYMEDLIAKSLVIPVRERSRGGVKTIRLHDLLRDFCLDKANEKHFFTLLEKRNLIFQDPRRLIINNEPNINDLRFSCHSIRSMICFGNLEASEVEKRIGSYDMVLLKVLEVHALKLGFPDVSSLVHLRYLLLSVQTLSISVLPSSIRKLQNLQILILTFFNLIEVPDFIFDMVKLRYVNISKKAIFRIDRNRLENSSFLLENLTFLSNVYVAWGNCMWFSKLSRLETLHCVLDHFDLFPKLRFNDNLTSLKVNSSVRSKQRLISTCQLPINLRKLTLSQFFLESNGISEIGRALPHLEVFKIIDCFVPDGFEWNMNDGDFPELKVLNLRDLKLSKWIASENAFPNLEQLWLDYMKDLDEIPLDFGYLLNLRLIAARECAPSVDDSARDIEKLQHEQNNDMKLHIYPRN